MSALVSVIIPTYNRASVIRRAIQSVVDQDYRPVELVIIDDASSDDTNRVIEEIKAEGLPFDLQYIVHPKNGGASVARNTGIRAAKGEFLAFLDSDDEYLPGKLSAQVRAFETGDPATGFVFTNYWETGRKKALRIRPEVPSGYVEVGRIFPASIFCNTLSCWMVRKSCLDAVGFFDEGIWIMEDLDMFARLVRQAPAYFLATPFVRKHEHVCKKGDTPGKYADQTAARVLEKWLPEMQRDRNAMFKFYAVRAKDMARLGKIQKAYDFLWKAWLVSPWRLEVICKMVRVAIRSLTMKKDGPEDQPLVTVVIPTYNRAHLLARAVKSVLAQTYQNIELIIVDDGSKDNTEEVVRTFSDPRIQYIRHEKNRGVSAARNTGIRQSTGAFLALLDSDDEYLPEKIEKSLKVFKSSSRNMGVVASNFWRMVDGKKHVGVSKKTPFLPFGVYAKEVFEKIGLFDESLEFAEDLDFGTRLSCNSFDCHFIDEPLAIYYFTQGSLSAGFTIERSIEIKKLILKKCAADLEKSRGRIARRKFARINYYLAKDLLSARHVEEARGYFWKAFLVYPIKIEYLGKFLETQFKR